jgi:hypothetical protein
MRSWRLKGCSALFISSVPSDENQVCLSPLGQTLSPYYAGSLLRSTVTAHLGIDQAEAPWRYYPLAWKHTILITPINTMPEADHKLQLRKVIRVSYLAWASMIEYFGLAAIQALHPTRLLDAILPWCPRQHRRHRICNAWGWSLSSDSCLPGDSQRYRAILTSCYHLP